MTRNFMGATGTAVLVGVPLLQIVARLGPAALTTTAVGKMSGSRTSQPIY